MGGMDSYDVAVLGGGPGGYAAALRAAQRGARVCCIERGRLGGTCLNVGCIPTKAMLHASELFWNIRHAGQFGFSVGATAVDGPAFMQRVRTVVDGLVKGLEALVTGRKVDVIVGTGRLIGVNAIEVAAAAGQPRTITAKSIILATGSRPARPAIFPWDSPRVFTSDEAAVAADLPRSIIIVGGGVVGCEFATVYSELGIAVTLIEMLDVLAAHLDSDAGRAVSRSLTQRGVQIVTGQKVVKMRAGADAVEATLSDGQELSAEACLVAAGRPANIDDIGLELAGVAVEGRLVKVDDACRTNVPNIYAVGDMAVGMQYAHLASRMGIVAADNATGHAASDDRRVVPVGLYTHPEVASVGLTEAQARKSCPNLRVGRFVYRASGMAQAYGQPEGQVKLLAAADSGKLVGAVVIGPHATDVVAELALAMRNNLGIEQIAATIHPHPTFVEAVGEAAESWLHLPLHSMI